MLPTPDLIERTLFRRVARTSALLLACVGAVLAFAVDTAARPVSLAPVPGAELHMGDAIIDRTTGGVPWCS